VKNDVVVVMDCGATNTTVIAIDSKGRTIASAAHPSKPVPQQDNPNWLIWDLDDIWTKLATNCRKVLAETGTDRLKAVTVTTFGADGAPVDKDGNLLYPVISWQCDRTEELATGFTKRMDPLQTFIETGYQVIPFNTLLRFLWLQEHAPGVLDKATYWLMMPALISHRLCGEFFTEPTSASTTMAMDLGKREWSEKMLAAASIDRSLFPPWVEPGEPVGSVHAAAAEQTGLPVGTPVIATGHDTQYAVAASGASTSEAVVSSGTWEILLLRLPRFSPSEVAYNEGMLFECDALAGLWNPQLLMMGSGVLEWIRSSFYTSERDLDNIYSIMVGEAEELEPEAGKVMIIPSFVPETGPTKKYNTHGTILGLELGTSRGEIYRAALEGLSFQLRQALDILGKGTGFSPSGIRVVGGGSRNQLWNQIRADVTGLPVTTISQTEATVLGAALFAFTGVDVYSTVEEAQKNIDITPTTFVPQQGKDVYEEKFERYLKVAPALAGIYRTL